MVIKRCHFDDTFKKILDEIENQFDIDIEAGMDYNINGLVWFEIIQKLEHLIAEISGNIYDFTKDEEIYHIFQSNIRKTIWTLLYLYKQNKEKFYL